MDPPTAPPARSDTETRLLDAAEEVFSELGYRATTTSAIAKRAGANKTLIHYYFRSKDGLYRAMLERISHRIGPQFLEDLALKDPVEAVSAAARRFVRLLADHPPFVRLCAYGALEGIEVRGDKELYERLVESASAAIRRGVDQGLFRPEDPRHVIASFEGMCRFFFEHEATMRELWGEHYDRQRIVHERSEHVVRMMLAGLGYMAGSPTEREETTSG
jgi:TetR/AcrR family transcriptional regulator